MGLMKLTPWWKSPWFWLAFLAYLVSFCVLTGLFGKSLWIFLVCVPIYSFVLAPLAAKAQLEADWELSPNKWDNILKDQK